MLALVLTKKLHMKIIESSSVGTEVLDERQTIILGVSINNSYFKKGNLERLITWASSKAKNVIVMIPDKPSVYTMVACGYEHDKAEREARLKANSLENKVIEIVAEHWIKNVSVIRWNKLVGNPRYLESLVQMKHEYDTDLCFRHATRQMTAEVITNGTSAAASKDQVDTGVCFLLEELAFILNAPAILGEEKVAYVYHKPIKILKDLLAGEYHYEPLPNVEFMTVE
jgi:cyclo(L-tyrosyl-L-tyrosyl) synthase